MQQALAVVRDDKVRGARQEELATYQQHVDPVAAQVTLAGAQRLNRYVLRPMQGIQYQRITDATRQGRLAAQYLDRRYHSPNDLVLGMNALIERLVFDPEHTDEFEAALAELGSHLGFSAQRPDKESGIGPDVLWAAASQHFYVIECKSGAIAAHMSRRDLAQLGQSTDWFDAQYGAGAQRTPVIVHPSAEYADDSTPPPQCRVITRDGLAALTDAARTMAVALAAGGSWSQEGPVAEQLRDQNLLAAVVITAHSSVPRRSRR